VVKILCCADLLVFGLILDRFRGQEGLKGGCGCFAVVVSEDEFVELDLAEAYSRRGRCRSAIAGGFQSRDRQVGQLTSRLYGVRIAGSPSDTAPKNRTVYHVSSPERG
jgi:hypothetical protein